MKGKYLNLRSEIIRAGFTCYNVAEAIGISPQALSQKMNGYSLFSAEEIARIGRLLNINKDDYYTISSSQLHKMAGSKESACIPHKVK